MEATEKKLALEEKRAIIEEKKVMLEEKEAEIASVWENFKMFIMKMKLDYNVSMIAEAVCRKILKRVKDHYDDYGDTRILLELV